MPELNDRVDSRVRRSVRVVDVDARDLSAVANGIENMYDDDLEQLSAGILLYDAFYRWCRDATRESHNWPTSKVKP